MNTWPKVNFARAILGLTICLSVPAYSAVAKPLDHLRVLVLVSGHAITNRQVWMDHIIENPASFADKSYSLAANQSASLERVITQFMVLEESKLLGNEKVADQSLTNEVFKLKKALGPKGWPQFLADFDVREADVRKRIEEKYQVQQAIEARVKAMGALPQGPKREHAITEAIQTWLGQLKTRYRVQRMRYEQEG